MTHDADLIFAHRLADRAETIALRHRAAALIPAEIKIDRSPVSEADREIETTLRSMIHQERPGDTFLGEEFGAHGDSDVTRRWVVDAIDGTAAFVAGEPEWSTMIALENHETPLLGLVSAPALRRRWWATPGGGAWSRPGDDPSTTPEKLVVTTSAALKNARVGIWPPPHRLTAAGRAIAAAMAARAGEVLPRVDWTRASAPPLPPRKPSAGSGTCHGALLVATGRLDAFLLLGGGRWDLAAVIPIVEEAGGAFSELLDERLIDCSVAVFTNTRLHEEVLNVARSAARA
ncbi:inositol monophosphatase family protein [Nonomuraea sp. SYSU D8015]|uniref:inositol monophosphatase family protein n=1 Tax=Nonomuraea sp. SYSU D8015 TaxID=2593644 RepID=UPI001661405A|nr:inositol monophosphatase family protein [Nonomuraea sp. SYSU D8015]